MKMPKFDRDMRQQVAEGVVTAMWTFVFVAAILDLSGQPMGAYNRLSTWAWTFGALLAYEVVVIGYVFRTRTRESGEHDTPIVARFVGSSAISAILFTFVMILLIRYEEAVPYFNNRENGYSSAPVPLQLKLVTLDQSWTVILYLTGAAYAGVMYGSVMSHLRNNFIPSGYSGSSSVNGRAGGSRAQMTRQAAF